MNCLFQARHPGCDNIPSPCRYIDFSVTSPDGNPVTDFDFLVLFVAHVTDVYPTTVFNEAFRPNLVSGASGALQSRCTAFARDTPMAFQLALGIPEDAKDWWYSKASLTEQLVSSWGTNSTIADVFSAHPEVVSSLFEHEAYGLRSSNGMVLRHSSGVTYLWVPKVAGSIYGMLSAQTVNDHTRPASYSGANAAPVLVARGLQAKFDKYISNREAASLASSSSSSSSSNSKKRDAPSGLTVSGRGRWTRLEGPGGAQLFSISDLATGENRTIKFTPSELGGFVATGTVNSLPSSISFSVADNASAERLLDDAAKWVFCPGFGATSVPRGGGADVKDEYKRGFASLSASSRVAAGWAAHDGLPLPPRVLGVLWGDATNASAAAEEPGDSSGDSGAEGADGHDKVPRFYLSDPPAKAFASAPVDPFFFSADCEGYLIPDGVDRQTGATPTPASGGISLPLPKWCVGCRVARPLFRKRVLRAASRTPEMATRSKTTAASLANEPWFAARRQDVLSKKACTLRGMLYVQAEALSKAEGLFVSSVEENEKLRDLLVEASKAPSSPGSSTSWIDENFSEDTVRHDGRVIIFMFFVLFRTLDAPLFMFLFCFVLSARRPPLLSPPGLLFLFFRSSGRYGSAPSRTQRAPQSTTAVAKAAAITRSLSASPSNSRARRRRKRTTRWPKCSSCRPLGTCRSTRTSRRATAKAPCSRLFPT